MKRFVRVRAVEGIAVPDPRDPEFGPEHSGQRRFLGRKALGRDALQALAKREGCIPRELDICERHPSTGEAVVVELDATIKKLIARKELEQCSEVLCARTAAKARECFDCANTKTKLSVSDVGRKAAKSDEVTK
jgi:hypothetical protein